MKITSVETLCLSRAHEPERQWVTGLIRAVKADCPIVVIDTDEGVRGIAEPSAYGTPSRIRERVTELADGLIGRDPLDPDVTPGSPAATAETTSRWPASTAPSGTCGPASPAGR